MTETAAEQAMLEAQVGVLGSMLIDAATVGVVMAETTAQDFHTPQYRMVYETMRRLFDRGEAVDPIAVNEALGGSATALLVELMNLTPTAVNCGEYLRLLKRASALQRMRTLGAELMAAQDLETAQAAMERAQEMLARRQGSEVLSLRQGVREFIARHEEGKAPEYLPWEFGLSEYLFIERGDLVILGARPSAGKTAFALQEAVHQARTRRVGFFSFETAARKLTDRAVACQGEVRLGSIKTYALTEEDCESVVALEEEMAGVSLEFIHAVGMTVSDIRALTLARHYEVVYIDYLQLIAPSAATRGRSGYEIVTQLSRDLHAFSQSSGTTVVALSQLSRAGKGEQEYALPRLSDLRESGQIEQDADVVLFLSTENPRSLQSRRVLKVAKNKDGLSGAHQLLDFDGAHQRFSRAQRVAQMPQRKSQPRQRSLFHEEAESADVPF